MARYEYDGLGRRVKKHLNADTDDDFDEFQHFYYNASWQILETRLATSESDEPEDLYPQYQYVWSQRYIDAPVLRDKNTDTDDLCDDERLYYLTDANMNVTALVGTDGDAVERYVYDPYGKVTIYDDDWSETRNSSSYDNNILYCGYYHDWETGLYHVRNRYLHVYLAWLSRDPRGHGNTRSLYEYVSSRPLALRDPSGLAQEGYEGEGPAVEVEPPPPPTPKGTDEKSVFHTDWGYSPLGWFDDDSYVLINASMTPSTLDCSKSGYITVSIAVEDFRDELVNDTYKSTASGTISYEISCEPCAIDLQWKTYRKNVSIAGDLSITIAPSQPMEGTDCHCCFNVNMTVEYFNRISQGGGGLSITILGFGVGVNPPGAASGGSVSSTFTATVCGCRKIKSPGQEGATCRKGIF